MAHRKQPRLIVLDDRGRVSLARIVQPGHRQFIVTIEPDGTIILTPAVTLDPAEAARLGVVEFLDGGPS